MQQELQSPAAMLGYATSFECLRRKLLHSTHIVRPVLWFCLIAAASPCLRTRVPSSPTTLPFCCISPSHARCSRRPWRNTPRKQPFSPTSLSCKSSRIMPTNWQMRTNNGQWNTLQHHATQRMPSDGRCGCKCPCRRLLTCPFAASIVISDWL